MVERGLELLFRPRMLEEEVVIESAVRCHIEPYPGVRAHSDVGGESYVPEPTLEVVEEEPVNQRMTRMRLHPRQSIGKAIVDLCALKLLLPQDPAITNSDSGKQLPRQCLQLRGWRDMPWSEGIAHAGLLLLAEGEKLPSLFLTEKCEQFFVGHYSYLYEVRVESYSA